MSLILDAEQIRTRFGDQGTPSQWTAVIPAAGKGSRLGYDLPKILYPLHGKPMLSYLMDLLQPSCQRIVLVLSPEGRAPVEKALRDYGLSARIALQERPLGMGDAVQRARPEVDTPFVAVVWGDQVALRASTIRLGTAAHERRPGALATIPTFLRKKPYIHFERNELGKVVRVLQAREAPIPHPVGENDAGVFFFTSQALFERLEQARERGLGIGRSTGEFNLLETLPSFEEGSEGLCTLRIVDEEETIGINTPEEAERVSQILAARSAGAQGENHDGR